MPSRTKYLVGAALAVFAIAYAGSPYWAVHQTRSAIEARDPDRLAMYVDFPAVRESLKNQLTANFAESMAKDLKDNPVAGVAGVFAAKMVEGMIDTFVTPDGLVRLIEKGRAENPTVAGGSVGDPKVAQAPLPVSQRYTSLDTFEVVFGLPSGASEAPVLRFRRTVLFQWKLTSLRVPFPLARDATAKASLPAAPPPPAPKPPSEVPGEASADRFQARIMEMQSAVARDPKNFDAWVQLGNDYFDTRQPQKAIDAYTRALEIRPNSPNVLADQGVMYRELGQIERAVASFQKANEVDPKHVQSLFNLGVVYMNDLRQPKKAMEAWKRVIQTAPQSEQATQARAAIKEARASGY